MPLYHVTLHPFMAGDVINPGGHGRTVRAVNTNGGHLTGSVIIEQFWELCLESARQADFPGLPSRLACVFASESIPDALTFHGRFRSEARSVLEVEPTMPDVKTFRGDSSLISDANFARGDAFIDFMPKAAVSYWRDSPKGVVEVLIPSPVKVVTVTPVNKLRI